MKKEERKKNEYRKRLQRTRKQNKEKIEETKKYGKKNINYETGTKSIRKLHEKRGGKRGCK